MVTTDVELQLTQQLKEAGKRLSHPPTSDDDLPHVLDQTEKLLSMVDQSPNELMKEALDPLIKGLVDKSLLEHSNVDVKVAVASCLSEITRITAPEAPYNDEELKDVFQLIVSTFEDLSDKSSQSYIRRTSILETVCKVRSCVIMLDLECEELIVEMFEHFFKSIRDHHNENIFSNMVDIMHLIFEESEDISVNMLKPLLSSIKNDNEGVLPVARKLGEKALQKAASILKPYLKQTLIILGDSLDNYSPVLSAICEGKTNFEQNETRVLVQQQTDEEKAKECPQDTPQADESKTTKVSSGDTTSVVKENAEKPATVVATPNRTLKIVMSNGGKVVSKKIDLTDKDSLKKPEEAVDHQDSSLTSKVDVSNSVAEVANTESKAESNNEGKENDVVMESVEPSNSSHGENKNEKENDIQVESKPEETFNKEGDKSDDATMTSAENKDDKMEENGDIQVSVAEVETEVVNVLEDSNVEKVDLSKSNKEVTSQEKEAEVANVPEESNVEKVDLSKSNKEVTPQEKEAEVADVPEESNVEKVDMSNKEDAEVANDTGLTYKIHIRKGPRSKKKGVIKDDTPLIDVLNKKVILLPQKAKIPAVTTAMSEDDKANSGSDAKVVKRASKKPDKFGSGAKPETKSGKKVGGGGLKKKRKLSGKKSGGRGSGAKRSKQSGKKVDEEGKKGTTPLSDKDNESDDSYDKPLILSTNKKEKSNTENKEDESDSDSKAVKKGNKEGKKNESGENVEEKDEEKEKTLPENDGMEISPKITVKTVTEEGKIEGTPVITSKRKRSVAKYEVKKDIKYDDSLIGKKVKVWWPDDKKYYEGVIDSFDPAKNKHKVSYVDGDQERLNLKKEKWEVIEKFSASNKKKPAEDESEDDEKLSEMITYKSKTKVNDSGKSTEEGDAEEETPGKSTGSKSRRKRKRKM